MIDFEEELKQGTRTEYHLVVLPVFLYISVCLCTVFYYYCFPVVCHEA